MVRVRQFRQGLEMGIVYSVRAKNSLLALASVLNTPCIDEVIISPCFLIPLHDMQEWLPLMTTPQPKGSM